MFKNKDAIGRRLRDLRKEHKVSGIQLAQRTGCTQSLISKIENGKIKPSIDYIKKFSLALSLSNSIENELLQITTAFLLNFDRWSQDDSSFADLQEVVRSRELKAKTIQSFSLNLMSGLVQTESYARAIFALHGTNLSEKEVTQALRVRMRRQSVLDDINKTIQIVISEGSLGNWIAEPQLMEEQLNKLKAVIQEGRIELRILPFFTRTAVLPITSFALYDEGVVGIETQTLSFQLWEKEEIELYKELFRKMLVESVSGRKAIAMIDLYLERGKEAYGVS